AAPPRRTRRQAPPSTSTTTRPATEFHRGRESNTAAETSLPISPRRPRRFPPARPTILLIEVAHLRSTGSNTTAHFEEDRTDRLAANLAVATSRRHCANANPIQDRRASPDWMSAGY